jgi:Major intrinsic protein
MENLARRLTAEFVGTCLLVAAVVGSGVMADNLTDDVALALLCNTIATAAALVVLISVFASLSGGELGHAAHERNAAGGICVLLFGAGSRRHRRDAFGAWHV